MPVSPKSDLIAPNALCEKINRGLEGALAEAERFGYVSPDQSKQQRSDLLRKARVKRQRKPSAFR